MQKTDTMKAVQFSCPNCKKEAIGWQDGEGLTRFQCPRCGTVTVSKAISRRHVQMDIYAPKGQVLIESYN